MNSTSQINYQISEQDYLAAQKLAIRNHPREATRLVFRILPFWGLFLALGILWPMFLQPIFLRRFQWNIGTIMGLPLSALLLCFPLLLNHGRKAAYRRNASLHGRRSVAMDEQGLSFQGPNYSSQLKWPIFVKFAEDSKAFVLFQSNGSFNLIPKRQLSPQQISDLREAFTRHIAKGGKS